MLRSRSIFISRTVGTIGTIILLIFLTACADTELAPPEPVAENVEEAELELEAEAAEPELTILAFGDSLTEGFGVDPSESYPAQLEQRLLSAGYNIEVINGGISGETTTAALTRLDWMLNTNPDIVIVETGGNDALRGVDIDLTRQNLDEIVRRFSENGAVVIVGGLQIVQNLGEEYTAAFAGMYPTIARRYEAILIPFMLEGVAADPELNQPDFIHPTAEGYTVMVEHIFPFVVEGVEEAQRRQ